MLRREACITLRATSSSRWWPPRLAVLSRRQLSPHAAAPQHAIRSRSYASSATSSQDASSGEPLCWQQLHRAAQVAYWSGLCYLRDGASLSEALQQQRLTLVAHGRSEYTSWFIADGVIPHDAFCSIYSSRHKLGSSGSSSGAGQQSTASSQHSASRPTNRSSSNDHILYTDPQQQTSAASHSDPSSSTANSYRRHRLNATPDQSRHTNGSSGSSSGVVHGPAGTIGGADHHVGNSTPTAARAAQKADPAAAGGREEVAGACGLEVPPPQRERFVFFRGVQWAAPEVNSLRMGQVLAALWPAPFAAELTTPRGALVAHSGVSQVASDLFDQLRPYLDQGADAGLPLCFAGHSLGGSLGTLVMAHHALASRRRRSSMAMTCYTFGSPPVLAHAEGGGGTPVMGLLGLPASALRNFALENDPVPRALLSVDPTYQVLQQWGAVRGLLQLRERLVGAGAPLSPGRFLYEAVGEVHLIKWTPSAGTEVVPLNSQEVLHELGMLGLAPSDMPNSSSSSSGNSTVGGSSQTSSAPSAAASPATSSNSAANEPGVSPAGVLSWLTTAAHDLTPRLPWQSQSSRSSTPDAASGSVASSSSGAPASPTPPSSSSSSHPPGHVGVGVNRLTDKAPAGPGNPAAAGVAALLSPWRSLQAWLDHHHGSYAQELETAALKQMKVQLRAQQLTAAPPQQQQQPQQSRGKGLPDVAAGQQQHQAAGQPQHTVGLGAGTQVGSTLPGPAQHDSSAVAASAAAVQHSMPSVAGTGGGLRDSAVAVSST